MNELQYKMKAKSRCQPSKTVEALFTTVVVKIKADAEVAVAEQKAKSEAETAETIARVKAEAEEKARAYTDTISRIKAEAEEKARAYTDTISGIKAEAEEKARAYTGTAGKGKPSTMVDALFSEVVAKQKAKSEAEVEEKARAYTGTVGKVKAEAEEAIAKVKTEAEEAIAKVRAEAEEETRVYTDTTAKVKAEEKATMRDEGKEQPVSETIQRITQSPAVLPGEHSRKTSALCTKDIMQKELVWGSPDDSVQQTFAKMQQHGAGYMMVGQNGVLEGIVSRSDLTGAISPYLRPIFAKWRRPMDDATLQIRIKWVMSRPVHIISPQMPLGAIMRNMCRSHVRALPVADQQGKVQGLVTEADIFKVLLNLKSSPNISASANEHQEQPTSDHFSGHREIESTPTMDHDLVAAV